MGYYNNTNYISRKILNYGLDLDTNQNFLKTELVTSRFTVSNLLQLDIHVAIASYLTKIPNIYCHKVSLNKSNDEDYIFFSDPDEIPNPKLLINFELKKKYGIFFQKCFNYKFNLLNSYETPWEGTRVCKKKNLKSIDFMRQKIKSKNLNYSFLRLDKEKSIEIFEDGGWHFTCIRTPEDLEKKLLNFAHHYEYEESGLKINDLFLDTRCKIKTV